jgi:hypothetical protein
MSSMRFICAMTIISSLIICSLDVKERRNEKLLVKEFYERKKSIVEKNSEK